MNRFFISQAIDTLIVRIEEAQTLAEQLSDELLNDKNVVKHDIRHDASLPKVISDLGGLAEILDRALKNSLPDHFDRLEAPNIRTTYVHPPIPIRTSDWCACIDGQEEDGPYGWGATEADAIADLKERLEVEA
jgi:hypothetical protein